MLSRIRACLLASAAAAVVGLATPGASWALALGSDFAADYSVSSLGSVPGLPPLYGGLTFLDSSTLLIGGAANGAAGRLYTIGVVRGSGGHVIGFTGSATVFGSVGEYNDGGVVFGPGGVLFTSRWPVNGLGQTKPGSTDEDKIIDLSTLGVAGSHAALNFVPAGFDGAGKMKLVSYIGGQFYTATLAPDGSGTFDITGVVQEDLDPLAAGIQNLPGGPEGFVYIDGANAAFGADSLLISDYAVGSVSAYRLDADGNPLVSTRRSFLTGLSGAEGATIDPVTGDFLFSTFGGGNQVVAVQGFIAPPTCGQPGQPDCPTPEPGTLPMAGLVLVALPVMARMNQRRRQRIDDKQNG